uniref:Uncharacterized protein n=1 Tax=Cairina moschata TaxID=8855 RepID=A0A8C3CEY6_CAIMO
MLTSAQRTPPRQSITCCGGPTDRSEPALIQRYRALGTPATLRKATGDANSKDNQELLHTQHGHETPRGQMSSLPCAHTSPSPRPTHPAARTRRSPSPAPSLTCCTPGTPCG